MNPADEHQEIGVEVSGWVESGAEQYGSVMHQVSLPNLFIQCAVAESSERPILHQGRDRPVLWKEPQIAIKAECSWALDFHAVVLHNGYHRCLTQN
jgi:hypothetical protein